MPAQIIVVKRPRSGLFALVRSVPAWLRAVWSGDALAATPRSGSLRTSPLAPDASQAPESPTAPAVEADELAPAGGSPVDEETLSAVLAGQAARLDRSREGMLRIEIPAAEATALLRRLREDSAFGFDRLLDLTVVDRAAGEGRFEVVYFLAASASGARLRVHAVLASESLEIDSVTPVWSAADWLEREAHDLFGVVFKGHPDLERILLPGDFEGAPLRKDFVASPPPEGDLR
jgi:NADH-quinone oxidoreductase subunit C